MKVSQTGAKVAQTGAKVAQTGAKVAQTGAKVAQTGAKVGLNSPSRPGGTPGSEKVAPRNGEMVH